MKKMNKKGFTIVELVIVIAVIAILAAVLIPTFSGVVDKANKSAAMQAARNEYEMYLAEYAEDLDGTQDLYIVKGDYMFKVEDGQFSEEALDNAEASYEKTADMSKVYKVADMTGVFALSTDYYTYNKGVFTQVTVTTAPVSTTTYYKLATPSADLGSADVAIYAAK